MIVCPSLPKDYMQRAKAALGVTDDKIVEASYAQWYQNHPDVDELPSMEELKRFNADIASPKNKRAYTQQNLFEQNRHKINTIKGFWYDRVKNNMVFNDLQPDADKVYSAFVKLAKSLNSYKSFISADTNREQVRESFKQRVSELRAQYGNWGKISYVETGNLFTFNIQPYTKAQILDKHINTQIDAWMHGIDIDRAYQEIINAPEEDETLLYINPKKIDEYIAQIKKRRPTIGDWELRENMKFLKDLENTPDMNAYVKQCIEWIKRGYIRLPEDDEFLRQIWNIARAKHIDIQKFDSPVDLYKHLNKNTSEKGMPFVPERYPHFKYNSTKIVNGKEIEIYDVEDSDEGRQNVCQCLADTFDKSEGKPIYSSPWCLSTFNYNAETKVATPTESANHFWGHYPGTRRIAIYDHRPVAFQSGLENQEACWWDFEDRRVKPLEQIYTDYKAPTRQRSESIQLGDMTYNFLNNTLVGFHHYTNRASIFLGHDYGMAECKLRFRDVNNSFIHITERKELFLTNHSLNLDKSIKINYDELPPAFKELIDYVRSFVESPDLEETDIEPLVKRYTKNINKIDELMANISKQESHDFLFGVIEKHLKSVAAEKAAAKPTEEPNEVIIPGIAIPTEEPQNTPGVPPITEPVREAAQEIMQATREANLNDLHNRLYNNPRTAVPQEYTTDTEYNLDDLPYLFNGEEYTEYRTEEDEEIQDTTDNINARNHTNYPTIFIKKVLSILRGKDLNKMYQEKLFEPENKELMGFLQDILKKYGVEYIFTDLQEQFGNDALGICDFLNKVIYLTDNAESRNAITNVEEFAHQFIKLMGSRYVSKKSRQRNPALYEANKDYTKLFELIEDSPLYKETYDLYSTDPRYQYKNGKPNIYKIKEEAIGKALATVITEEWDKSKESDTFLTAVKDWFEKVVLALKGIFSKDAKLEKALNDLADSIIDGTYHDKYLRKLDDSGYKLTDYTSTILEQNAIDNGVALDIMKFLSDTNSIITGSIAYRKQGTVYRSTRDNLHDIDVIVPEYVGNLWIDNPELRYYHQRASVTKERLEELVSNTNLFRAIKDHYPSMELIGAYFTDPKTITANLIICDNAELRQRFLSMEGDFGSRLKRLLPEEQEQIYLVDLFYQNSNSQKIIYDNEFGLNLSDYTVPMASKLKFSRAKDIYDYQRFIPRDRHYFQSNNLYMQKNPHIFNTDKIDTDKVDFELFDREKNGYVEKALRIYIKGKEKGWFEVVKDIEPNRYSVHFKTNNTSKPIEMPSLERVEGAQLSLFKQTPSKTITVNPSTSSERHVLYGQVRNALPEGAEVSTWGSISEGGIYALNKLGGEWPQIGERELVRKSNNSPVQVPIFKVVNNQEKTYAQRLEELHKGDVKRTQMLQEMSKQDIQDCARLISSTFDSFVESKLKKRKEDSKWSKVLTGDKWQDKRRVIELYGAPAIFDNVKDIITEAYTEQALLENDYSADEAKEISQRVNTALKYYDQLKPYVLSYLKKVQPVTSNEALNQDLGDEQIDESTLLEHWQIEHLESSVFSMLDPLTKDVIGHLEDIYSVDEEGDWLYNMDSLFKPKIKDSRDVTKKLINIIGKLTDPKDMIPALVEASKQETWMGPLVDLLLGENSTMENYTYYYEDDTAEDIKRKAHNLQALFWKDFHKPFLQLAVLDDSGYTQLNSQVTNNKQLQIIQDFTYSQAADNDQYIFKDEGKLNAAVYDKMFDLLREGDLIYKMLGNQPTSMKEVENEIKALTTVLNSLGLQLSETSVKDFVHFREPNELRDLRNVLFSNIFNKNKDNNAALTALRTDPRSSVFSSFYSSYVTLANLFSDSSIPDEESRVTTMVDGEMKTMYDHVVPNQFITTMDKFHQAPDQVKRFIESEFLYDFHYMDENGEITNPWLRELYEGKVQHNSLVTLAQLVASHGISYIRENATQAQLTRLEAFFKSKKVEYGNTEYALYSVGTFADAKASYYVKNKVRPKAECIKGVTDLFLTELDRLIYTAAKKKAMERTHTPLPKDATPEERLRHEQEKRYEIEFFDNKNYFLLFPSMADKTAEILNSFNGLNALDKRAHAEELVAAELEKAFASFKERMVNLGIEFTSDHKEIVDRLTSISSEATYDADLEQFYYNQFLANACIDSIFSIDYGYHKDTDQKQKRFKRNYSPYQTAYTCCYLYDDNYNPVEQNTGVSKDDKGNPIEYFILLTDNNTGSRTKNVIIDTLKQKVEDKLLTKEQYGIIAEGLDEIDLSDGQAYRTLESWRNLMNMIGQGQDEKIQTAIEKLLNGSWDYEAYQATFNVWKPLVSSSMRVDTGITREDLKGVVPEEMLTDEYVQRFSTLKVPTMHKNSEFLLLAMFNQIQGIVKQSPKLKALNRFMSDFGIDKAQFMSANKLGNHGAIDLNIEVYGTYEDGKFVDDEGQTMEPNGKTAAIYVDKNTDDGYIWNPTNNSWHKLNKNANRSESYNLLLSEYESYIYNILCNACGLDKSKPHKLIYNQGYNNNVIHCEPLNDWGIITNLPEHLLEHETGGLGTQTIKIIPEDLPAEADVAFNLNGTTEHMTGEEVLDVYQNLLADYVIKAFAKIDARLNTPDKFREFIRQSLAAQTQVPQDLDNCLELDGKREFKISPVNPIRNKQFLSFCASLIRKKMIRRNVKQGLLPQVANYGLEDTLLLRYQDDEGHLIFTQKEFAGNAKVYSKSQEEWLKAMQAKYPTYRAYAKSADGKGTRILHMEIAMPLYDAGLMKFVDTETGMFDREAFERVVSPEAREALGYRTPTEAKHSMIPAYIKELMPFQNASCVMMAMDWIFLSGSDMDSDKLFTLLPELEIQTSKATGEVTLVKPKEFKISEGKESLHDRILQSIHDNDIASCNNMLLWLMRGILQTKENLSHIMTPNGFDTARHSGQVNTVLKNPMFKVLNNGTTDLENGVVTKADIDMLLNAKSSILKKLAASSEAVLSPADPALRVLEQDKNMVGLQLVAIFAVFRAFMPLLQKTSTYVMPAGKKDAIGLKGDFILNGNQSISNNSLSNTQNSLDQFISDLVGELIGTSVDNAKDPIVDKMGITLELAPYMIYLVARGYSFNEISLLFNQPVIKDILFEYILAGGERSLYQIIQEKRHTMEETIDSDNINNVLNKCQLFVGDLAKAINNDARGIKDYDIEQFEYVVLRQFEKIIPNVRMLNDIASQCRNSTFSGAIASTDVELLHKYLQYKAAELAYSDPTNVGIKGLWNLVGGGLDLFEDTLRENALLKSNILLHNVSFVLSTRFRSLVNAFSAEYLGGRAATIEEIDNLRKFVQAKAFADRYLNVEVGDSPFNDVLGKLVDFYSQINPRFVNAMSNRGVSLALLLGVPKLVSMMKSRGILTEETDILSKLTFGKPGSYNGLPTLRILGNKTNPDTLEEVKRAWQDLYDNPDETHELFYKSNRASAEGRLVVSNKELADLLFLYNLQTTGIVPTSSSFIEAIPDGYEILLPNYAEICSELQDSYVWNDAVMTDYILNHAQSSRAVHKISQERFINILGLQQGMELTPAELIISGVGPNAQSFLDRNGAPYQFVGIQNTNVLYRLDPTSTKPHYIKVNMKGINGRMYEYFGETIVPANVINNFTPGINNFTQGALNYIKDVMTSDVEQTPEETSQKLQGLFGDNITPSLVNPEQVTSKEVDETGFKVCATIK